MLPVRRASLEERTSKRLGGLRAGSDTGQTRINSELAAKKCLDTVRRKVIHEWYSESSWQDSSFGELYDTSRQRGMISTSCQSLRESVRSLHHHCLNLQTNRQMPLGH